MNNKIVNGVVQWTKKNAPTILVTLGIGSIVGGTIVACVQTKNVDPILEEHIETLADIKKAVEAGEVKDEATDEVVPFTEADNKKAVVKCYAHTVFELGKLYWKSGVMIGGGIFCILKSHGILQNRLADSTASLASVSSLFAQYRENIVKKYGEQADVEARYSLEGKKKKGKKGEEDSVEYLATEQTSVNDFSVFLNENTFKGWDESPDLVLHILKNYEADFNRKLFYSFSNELTLFELFNAMEIKITPKMAKLAKRWGYRFRPGIDPLGENGLPQKVRFGIYNICGKHGKDLATIEDAQHELLNPFPDVDKQCFLITFPNIEYLG